MTAYASQAGYAVRFEWGEAALRHVASERDVVIDAVSARGDVIFHVIAVKPGMPTLFARIGKQLVFGMPGNPTSVKTASKEPPSPNSPSASRPPAASVT